MADHGRYRGIWLVFSVAGAICAGFGCGPADGGDRRSGADAEEHRASEFTRQQQYPGYCRGLVNRDLDEVPDAVEYSTFDGELLKIRSLDSNRDGNIERRTTFAYGDQNRLVKRAIDEGADGRLDEVRLYEYGADGRLTRERVDRSGDGSVDLEISYSHDDAGRRVRGEGRSTATDEVELVLEYQWTDGGSLDRLTIDGIRGAPDGRPDRVLDYLYDSYGNLDEGRFDYDGNGRADIIVFYTYECWRGYEG